LKLLENIIERIRPHFEQGGSLRILHPLFEGIVDFIYRQPIRTREGSHIRDSYDLKRMMMIVIISLIPCAIFGIYNTGYQHYLSQGESAGIVDCLLKGSYTVIPLYIVAFTVGTFWELLFAIKRKTPIAEGLLVTGFLIPLIMPPTIPLWQVAVATSFGVVLGKEIFGGVGMNIFNPALVTRAFIFFAYPRSMSGNEVWTLTGERVVDAFTMATPLSLGAEATGNIVDFLHAKGYTFWKIFIGLIPGSIGETSIPAIALGALLLLLTGVGSWRIMVSVFAGGVVMSLILNMLAPSPSSLMALPVHYHLVMGSFAFGAVFMATDPVSAASTNQGKYGYGFFIGVLAIMVRALNPAYPEGMMLSILFMNLFAPLIDFVVLRTNVRRRMKRAAG
jgi:Na+-transporting NADH:ubiquinone oxidoreductase subunit B